MAAEEFGNGIIGATLPLRTVQKQQNTGACLLTGGALPGANDAFELLALFKKEGKADMFCHTLMLPPFRKEQNVA